MKKSQRPLGSYKLDQLEELYARQSHDPRVLYALRAELLHRKPTKTELLRQRVNRHFRSEEPVQAARAAPVPAPQPVVFACLGCQTKLRLSPAKPLGVARCPHCGREYGVQWQGPSCLVAPRSVAAPTHEAEMTAEEARSIIGVAPDADWPASQKAARALLQQLHPDRNADAAPAVRKAAEAEFKRVKHAYAVLNPRQREECGSAGKMAG